MTPAARRLLASCMRAWGHPSSFIPHPYAIIRIMSLDVETPETVRLSVSEATALGERALTRVGYSGEDARIIVDQLVDNALCGYKFAGLPRILAIAGDEKTAKQRTPVRIVHETPVSALLDGGNNVGY